MTGRAWGASIRCLAWLAAVCVGACGGGGGGGGGQDDVATRQDTGPVAATDLSSSADLPPAPDAVAGTVTLSGVAYTFDTPNPLAGATIALAEHPEVSTVSGADGRFSLTVPDGETITPFGARDGYKTMHVQTFTTAGEDITDAYFQMIYVGTYDMFAVILGITPSDDHCQISSTVNEKAIQGMTYEDFAAHGHHGVAGATVTAEPPVPELVYFDEQTQPDRSLTETTIDGGVVATNVPPGLYVFTAHHPERSFDTFTATCEPGRFINANPPWGMRER